MAVQAYLHMQNTVTVANSASVMGSSVMLDHGVEVSLAPEAYSSNNTLLFETATPGMAQDPQSLQRITQTEVLGRPRYDLKNEKEMEWISGTQQRKCTLCLEELKDPSVTVCGHVFCWGCIGDWAREKPECPLCRQSCLVQHVLPLRGY